MQSNGDLVLAGDAQDASGNTEYAIARFTSTGLLDTSFGPSELGAQVQARVDLVGRQG